MAKRRSSLFEKNPDTLPFFSIHPATLAGRIVRITLIVFMAIVVLLNVISRVFGLVFMKYFELSYLIYLVPIALMLALCIIGLFKRMSTTFTKILVPGILGFGMISVFIAVASMASIPASFDLSPVTGLNLRGHNIAIMRVCNALEDMPTVVVNEGEEDEYTDYQFTYRSSAYRYTAMPADGKGTSEGEIYVVAASTYNIEAEWLDENTCRYYLAQDTEGHGYGEIIVRFDKDGTCVSDPESSYRSSSKNASGTHTANLYRADTKMSITTNSMFMMSEECFERIYTAYDTSLYYFINLKSDIICEGEIRLKPFVEFTSIQATWFDYDDPEHPEEGRHVMLQFLTDVEDGASGQIDIYFEGKPEEAAE